MERKYWREGRKALALSRQPVLDHAQNVTPEHLKAMVPRLLNSKPVNDYLVKLWAEVGGKFGYDTENAIKRQKSGNMALELKDDRLTEWQKRMGIYAAERSIQKTGGIMTAQTEAINRVIDGVIQESVDNGLGIAKTRKLLVDSLEGDTLTSIENWEAQRIAMTEVGSASNTASFDAAKDAGVNVQKVWMFIPGLKTFRPEHQGYEAMGPQDMDYNYDTEGGELQYPGDENGTAEQVINCYCSIAYETEI